MPKPSNKFVSVDSDELSFNKPGNYTLDFTGNTVEVNRGGGTVFTDAQWATIKEVDLGRVNKLFLTGVTFQEDSAAGNYEADNADALIGAILSTRGLDWAFENLSVNGSDADLFRLLWEYLDDQYVAGANYYALPLNETFVRLGVKYVEYLEAGGEPLTFDTAKFDVDTNSNGIPQREQSMHDNLLGNLTEGALNDRFSGDPVLLAELKALIPDEYESRPYYDGNEARVGGSAHDAVRAFDYDHGWDRPDYLDTNVNGVVDPLAQDPLSPGNIYNGGGQPADDWNIVRHEGAQVELGLKIKVRGGNEYPEAFQDSDGVWHYEVASGSPAGRPDLAVWNFDFSATDYSPDTDFKYTLEFDFDPGEGVQWVTLYSSDAPLDSDFGGGSTFQNSSNPGFYEQFMDTDPVAPGIQPYAFGEGEFNVRLSAYNLDTGLLVAQHEVIVHVPPII